MLGTSAKHSRRRRDAPAPGCCSSPLGPVLCGLLCCGSILLFIPLTLYGPPGQHHTHRPRPFPIAPHLADQQQQQPQQVQQPQQPHALAQGQQRGQQQWQANNYGQPAAGARSVAPARQPRQRLVPYLNGPRSQPVNRDQPFAHLFQKNPQQQQPQQQQQQQPQQRLQPFLQQGQQPQQQQYVPAPTHGVPVGGYIRPTMPVKPFNYEAVEAVDDPKATEQSRSRRKAVRDAFVHAMKSYSSQCWGRDELMPQTKGCDDWLHMGLTIVDSLDTMIIMGLEDEYKKSREWIETALTFGVNKEISFFDSNIRVVGGLLSAFDLTGDNLYLHKAKELVDLLLPAFSSSGVSLSGINLKTRMSNNPTWSGGCSILSEMSSFQLEFMYLSHFTNSSTYVEKALKVMQILDSATTEIKGLWPIYIRPENAVFMNSKICWGAMGDSTYEYLLKTWLISGRRQEQFKRMYVKSMEAMEKHLLQRQAGLTFITEMSNRAPINKMDQLVCFAPGMLALGAATGIVDATTAERHVGIAKEMMETCTKMYSMNPSGLAPEFVSFHSMGMAVGSAPAYKLRPETVESLFVMWRLTHDQKYRDEGWKIFEAILNHCRTESGFVGIQSVHAPEVKEDRMPSYFTAATLKYLYLLFSPDHVIPLNEYVFNTEGHPLRMPVLTDMPVVP